MVSSTDPLKIFGSKYWNLHFARFRGYSSLDRKRVSHWKMESLFLGLLREAIFSLAPRKCHIEAFVDSTRRSYVRFRNLFGELHGYLQLISSFEDTSQ